MKRITSIMLRVALSAAVAAGIPAAVAQSSNTNQAVQGQDNAKLQQDVQKKLGSDKFKNVQAQVEDGIVTLTGTVELEAQREQAEKKAKDVDHIQGVRNQIQVAGKQVSDQDLQKKLADKLRYDRIGQGIVFNSPTLNVQNGVATVGGTVRDEPDKSSALAIVENEPGVKGVRDEIQVARASFADDDLRVALARHIYSDPSLQKYAMDPQAPIRIVVNGGHVTLAGVVNN